MLLTPNDEEIITKRAMKRCILTDKLLIEAYELGITATILEVSLAMLEVSLLSANLGDVDGIAP